MKQILGTPKPFDFDRKLRECLAEVMSSCEKSRATIADELEKRVGRPVTPSMLNDFAARSHITARFPASWVPIFCEVTGNDLLQRMLLSEELRARLEVGEMAQVVGEMATGIAEKVAALSVKQHEPSAHFDRLASNVTRISTDAEPNSKGKNRA
jgi:hypothetical protein